MTLPAPSDFAQTVVVYVTRTCGFCQALEALLNARGISYGRVDVTGDARARRELRGLADGRSTVPQVFIKGEGVGGYTEVAALDRSGRLREWIG